MQSDEKERFWKGRDSWDFLLSPLRAVEIHFQVTGLECDHWLELSSEETKLGTDWIQDPGGSWK